MTARYLLCPGETRSRSDGQWHRVGASELARLYGVPMAACVVLPAREHGALGGGRARVAMLARADRGELVALWPRAEGDYRPPAGAPSVTRYLAHSHFHPALPWLAPDGRPWLAHRRIAHWPASRPGRPGPVWRACRLSINLIGVGPLARAALWALHRP